MKNIYFEKISIKNFLSIGNIPVEVDFSQGLNFITGENLDVQGTNNGSGKSTIVDAFNFAIFGDSLRNINKNQMINNISPGATEVTLSFLCDSPKGKNHFEIIRGLNPSSCIVKKDGVDKTMDSIANTNKYISEVLSASQEVFKNCVIMRANNTIPFMAQGRVEKKKFIENLFNLDNITLLFKAVKDDINGTKRDVDVELRLLEQLNNSLETYYKKSEEQINKEKLKNEENSNKINNIKNKIQETIEQIKKLKNDYDDTSYQDKIDTLTDDYSKLNEKINKNKIVIANLLSNIKFNKEEKERIIKLGDFCEQCKRPMSLQDKKVISDKIDKFTTTINEMGATALKIKKNSDNLILQLGNINKSIRDIQIKQSTAKQSKERIDLLYDNIRFYKSELESLFDINTENKKEENIFNSLITDTEKEITDKNNVISSMRKELTIMDVARFVLSEEGVRSYIIKKLLDLLNFRIKYYLTKQNAQYTLIFDEIFNEEIKNKKGILVSYGNLSGAESKMLDLACIWAFRDILKLQGSVNYDISFYDEILDSSMDATNSEIVCNILQEFVSKEQQKIYLISHKDDLSKMVTGDIIKLRKEKGITKKI